MVELVVITEALLRRISFLAFLTLEEAVFHQKK
jgi:hypothetical protein